MKYSLLLVLLLLGATSLPAEDKPMEISFIARPGQGCTQPCARRAIVFVHGLWGTENTWKNEATGRTWPELMAADQRFNEFDLFEFTYPTSTGYWASGNRVRFSKVAEKLNEELQSKVVPNYKSVHLIGHSMGGNMILTSMMFLKFRYLDAHQILNKYLNIILLGTPVEGADVANFAWLLSSDSKLIALKPIAENELPVLTELAVSNIDEKRQMQGLPMLNISAGYEEKRVFDSLIIVNKRSATAVARPEHIQGFDRDHISLVKPKDETDPVYVWVQKEISEQIPR